MKRIISVDEGLSQALAHDITEIRPNEYKGAAFHRGHILRGPDIEHLRRLGKEHLYVLEPESDEMHEDEAAVKIADALCGEGIGWKGPPREGKITLRATRHGLLKVALESLNRMNALGDVMCATIHTNTTVFDLIYPRILAGERITRQDLAVMGHGGYCLKCDRCRYPVCPFGKLG